jgi:ABC-type polysaccharide transport system permease subunit
MKAHMKEFLKELKKSRTLLLMLAPAVVIIFIFAYGWNGAGF